MIQHQNNRINLKFSDLYKSYPDFLKISGYTHEDDLENVFNMLYMKAGDTQTKWSSVSYGMANVAFYIRAGAEMLKLQGDFLKGHEPLIGSYAESDQYLIGDQSESLTDYDKYKSGRQTQYQITDKYAQSMSLLMVERPIIIIYDYLYNKIFTPFQVGRKRRPLW